MQDRAIPEPTFPLPRSPAPAHPCSAQPAAAGEAKEGPKPTWSKETVAGMNCDKMTLGASEMWFSPKANFSWMLDTETPMEKGGIVKMAYDGTVNSELLEQGKAELAPSMTLPAAK